MKEVYIIICSSSDGRLYIEKKFGTREEIQEYLAKLIADGLYCDLDNWLNGTISTNELDYIGDGNGMYGYSNFNDYSINYYAYPYADIPMAEED